MLTRARLQEALRLIAGQEDRFGEATVATAMDVLAERLATWTDPVNDQGLADFPIGQQRKQVTILFAALEGFTQLAGTARNTARLNEIDLLWRRIDETILEHGGVVDKHMGDVIMGVFGAPLARENDPERAVRCAMALREMVEQFQAGERESMSAGSSSSSPYALFRIGINTGQVSLGQVGSDAGITVIGDAVNVASRLKEADRNSGIYISQDTYRQVRNLFRFEPLGEVMIKGRLTPVTVYTVIGVLPRLFFPISEGVEGVAVPMVGREAELDALLDLLNHAAQARRCRVVTLLGEAGVGKTRLAREFHDRLEASPFMPVIFQGRGDQHRAGVAYSLMRDLLIRHFRIEENDQPAIIEEKIAHHLGQTPFADRQKGRRRDLRRRARAVQTLVGIGMPAALPASLDPGDADAKHVLAIESIADYFRDVITNFEIAVFFLEDIHWADDDSLSLLGRIVEAAAESPLLVVCLARPTLLERRPDWPGDVLVGAVNIAVRPLEESKCRELLAGILRKLPQVPRSLSDLIVRSSAGNPYFVEEMVRVLIEDGVIIPTQPSWSLRSRELTRLRVPATLTGVLQARLDRLPELERVVLQQAAVVGNEFWEGALQQINRAARFPFSEEQIRAALLSLQQRDMILRTPAPTIARTQGYLFKHTILREVAYESVLLRDRPGYHLQAVRWLETQMGDRAIEYAAPIAYHYEHAGRPAAAARLYEQAAARAVKEFKPSVAIKYYRKALDLLRFRPQMLDTRLAIKEQLGRILHQRGRLVEALDIYRVMHNSAELDGNLLAQSRALLEQATLQLELNEASGAADAADTAGRLARLTGADIEWVRAQLLWGEAAARMGDSDGAAGAFRQAVERSRSLDEPRLISRALAHLATITEPKANQKLFYAELRALIDELEQRGAIDDAAYAMTGLGNAFLADEDYTSARACFEKSVAWRRLAGSQRGTAESLQLLALTACRLGDANTAIINVEEASALAEAMGDRYFGLLCRLALGEALLVQGQYAAAEATLRQVIATAENRRRMGNWVHLDHARRLLVRSLTTQGRVDEARIQPG